MKEFISNKLRKIENEKARKSFLIYSFSALGMLTSGGLGFIGLLEHKINLYLFLLFSLFSLAIANMIYFFLRKNVTISSYIIVISFFIMSILIFTIIGVDNSGVLWYYVFSGLAILLTGSKNGIFYILLLSVFTVFFHINPFNFLIINYSNAFIVRFFITYTLVNSFILIFEYTRIQAHSSYMNTLKIVNEKNDELTKTQIEIKQQNEELKVISEILNNEKNNVEIKNQQLLVAYDELFRNEQKLNMIFETATEGIGTINKNAVFTFANSSFAALLGYSATDFYEMNYFEILAEPNKANTENFKKLLTGEIGILNTENLYLRKDGTTFWAKLSAKALKNKKGEIEEITGIITDIDTIKKSELKIKGINEKITSSINYACNIQNALLPSIEFINQLFPHNFIFNQPRDIVSGDFYFAKIIKNSIFLAVADCTGHGVPGAMMSMLGISQLNEILSNSEIKNSAQVLNELRIRIKNALQQTGAKNEQQDGMDISFIEYNFENNMISFAGGNSPMLLFRNNNLIEIKGDKMPIGIYRNEIPFTNHDIKVYSNDKLYFFTDGFHSQFGGPKNEKYRTTRFKELLSVIQNMPLPEQKLIIEKEFNEWKGTGAQTDDVLVIGIMINE